MRAQLPTSQKLCPRSEVELQTGKTEDWQVVREPHLFRSIDEGESIDNERVRIVNNWNFFRSRGKESPTSWKVNMQTNQSHWSAGLSDLRSASATVSL